MNVLSNAYRKKLIQALLTDPGFLRDARRFLDADDFAEGVERSLVSFSLSFFDKYGCAPDQFVIEDRCEEIGVDEDEVAPLLHEFAQPHTQTAFVKQKLIDFARNRKMMRALEKASSMLGHEEWAEIVSTLREAEVYGDVNPPSSLLFPSDSFPTEDPLQSTRVATGIVSLDDSISGGLPAGHIGCIVAPPNHGKSTFLISFGAQALRKKKNVVHFTLEMSKEQTASRYNQACNGLLIRRGPRKTNEPIGKLAVIESMSKKKVADLVEMIKTVPFRPDLVVVDYAALAKPSKDYKEFRHVLAEVFRELRIFAQESKVPVWTAHQATRNSMLDSYRKESTITMAHLSESFEIAAIVDLMVTLNSTDSEKAQNLCRVYTAKNRLGPANNVVTVYCDFAKCLVSDQSC
jgi:archaellum biogenesis ATPase FlaH